MGEPRIRQNRPREIDPQVWKTALSVKANPHRLAHGAPDDFTAWRAGLADRFTPLGGIETLVLAFGSNLLMRQGMRFVPNLVSYLPIPASQRAVFLASTTVLSLLMTGGMTLYQTIRSRLGLREAASQWGRALCYSLPSMMLGIGAMQRWGFGVTFFQDFLMEFAQAGISTAIGETRETLRCNDSKMGLGGRYLMELTEGLIGLFTGRLAGRFAHTGQARCSLESREIPLSLELPSETDSGHATGQTIRIKSVPTPTVMQYIAAMATAADPPATEPFDRFGRVVTEIWRVGSSEELARPLFDSLFFPSRHPSRIADLGAGVGLLSLELARRYSSSEVWVIDRAPLLFLRGSPTANIRDLRPITFEALRNDLEARNELHTFDLVYVTLPDYRPEVAETAALLRAEGGEIHMLIDDLAFSRTAEALFRREGLTTRCAEVPLFLKDNFSHKPQQFSDEEAFGDLHLFWLVARRRDLRAEDGRSKPQPWDLPPIPEGENLVLPTEIRVAGRLIPPRREGEFSLAGDSLVIDMEELWGRPMSDRPLWRGLRVDLPGYRVDQVDVSLNANQEARFQGKFVTDAGEVVGEFDYTVPQPPIGVDQPWIVRRERMELVPAHRGKGVARSFLQNWTRFLSHLGVDEVRASEDNRLLFDLHPGSDGWQRLFKDGQSAPACGRRDR